MTRVAQPRVSVIMRTKDRPLLLRRALVSVLRQTYSQWELCVVNDGGSAPPVEELVQQHCGGCSSRVRVLHHPESLGMEAASNAAIAATSADFVVIHDDDDAWAPTFLERGVSVLETRAGSSCKAVACRAVRVLERIDGERIVEVARHPYNPWLDTVTLWRIAAGGDTIPPISLLYRREVFDAVGGPYRSDLPVLGDWEFLMRLLQRFDCAVEPEDLAFYHHRVSADASAYGNSVHAGAALHREYWARLRNELLRRDLEAGKVGVGHLVNERREGGSIEHIRRVKIIGEALRSLGVARTQGARLAIFGAGQLGYLAVALARLMGLSVECIIDRDPSLQGTVVDGAPIVFVYDAYGRGVSHILFASFVFAHEMAAEVRAVFGSRHVETVSLDSTVSP